MQSGDRRCRHRVARSAGGGCGLSVCGSDEGRRDNGPSAEACGGEQLATTEFEVESGVLDSHRGEVAPRVAATAYRNLTTVRQTGASARSALLCQLRARSPALTPAIVLTARGLSGSRHSSP